MAASFRCRPCDRCNSTRFAGGSFGADERLGRPRLPIFNRARDRGLFNGDLQPKLQPKLRSGLPPFLVRLLGNQGKDGTGGNGKTPEKRLLAL